MLRLFPIKRQASQQDRQQSQLMIIAGLLVITLGLILTMAPAVRYQAGSERYQYGHWLGVAAWMVVFGLLHWQTSRKIPHRDPILLPLVGMLTGIGLMMIWRLYPTLGLRQTLWLILGGGIVWLGLQFPGYLEALRRYKYLWLILGLSLTGLAFLFSGGSSSVGSSRWLRVFGIHFQPSEPLKLLLIAYLAAYFTKRRTSQPTALQSFLPAPVVIGLATVLLISQKDLGTAMIFLAIFLAMLFTINGNRIILWVTPALLVIAGVAGYFLIDVVRLRFDTWLRPFSNPMGASYQVIQSMIAIAEGGLIGAGPGLGSPGLIPVAVSDFIFSATVEETGYLGAMLILLLFVFLVYRSARVALQTPRAFHRYLAIGIAFYFGFQSALIIGGNIGLLPLTGVTLPFVSYGGSSLIISFAAALILLTISHQAQTQTGPATPTASKRRLAFLSGLIIVSLMVEIAFTSLLSFWRMPALVGRPENPRWVIHDRLTPRGDILDRNNRTLVTNTGEHGEIGRVVMHTALSPVVGYTNSLYGQTGLETALYPYLRGLQGTSAWSRFWRDLLYNQPPEGLDVRLTLDLEDQKTADTLLGETPGAVILMNADSGEILAMASHPTFDPATLESDWETLIQDENAPLINRATQGRYPAGSALIPFLLTSQADTLQTYPTPADLLNPPPAGWDCAQPIEENPTWQNVGRLGCQSVQTALATRMGVEPLLDLYQGFGFFTAPRFRLPTADVSVPDVAEPESLFSGSDGFQISPLQMALAASALTHDGVLPAPRLVNGYQTPNGEWVTLPKSGAKTTAVSENKASQVTSLLEMAESPHWQVTASARTEEGAPITWFLAGTTAAWQGQPLVIVVTLEADDPDQAEAVGLGLLDQAMRLADSDPGH